MTEDERNVIFMILDTQEGLHMLVMDLQIRLEAAELAIGDLDERGSELLRHQLALLKAKQTEMSEETAKKIALVRAVVSRTVQ